MVLIKNSIIKRNNYEEQKNEIHLIVNTLKQKKINWLGGKKEFEYRINWIIREKLEEGANEINIIADYKTRNEKENSIIIRSVILGLILLDRNYKIKLGVDRKVKRLIKDFIENLSNRRRIDEEYYIELLFLESLIKKFKLQIIGSNEYEDEFYNDLNKKFKEKVIYMNEKKIYKFETLEEGLKTNEFNLYWKKNLILGEYRQWRKKCTDAIWKNEILNSSKIEDLFMKNYKDEINWTTSLKFISNKNKFSFWQCGIDDTRERAYKVKNLVKDLPTYKVLYERGVNGIENGLCLRCELMEEDWEHIWNCEKNEKNVREIIEWAIEEFESLLVMEQKLNEVKILREINIPFIKILQENSEIVIGKSKEWELLRGVYNNNLNKIAKEKSSRSVIEDLWNFCYEKIKKEIWIKRCEEVIMKEKEKGIFTLDKRKRIELTKKEDNLVDGLKIKQNNIKNKKHEENKKKEKNIGKRIKLVTRDKILDRVTANSSIEGWSTIVKIE
jgi:hypothetical protein